MIRAFVRLALVAIAALSTVHAVAAPSAAADQKTRLDAAWKAASDAAIMGPSTVKLLDQGRIAIAKGEAFVPAEQANQLMDALGNSKSSDRFGLIVGTDAQSDWLVDVTWTKEGYVRDGDAKEWQADDLLNSLREGTEAHNPERTARGLPAIDVLGWVQPPLYEAKTHRLIWSMSLADRGAPAGTPRTINYNTYALGRDGYFSLNLISGADTIAANKPVVHDLLSGLQYAQGKRYEDFDESTDKIAAYGLAALVGGVAVKKLGLLALAGVFLLKLWKLAVIGLIAVAAGVRKLFARRRDAVDEAGDAPVDAPAPGDEVP
jgi:uncharacterized membrane-anchored protein